MKDFKITKADKKLIDIMYPLGLGVTVLLFLLFLEYMHPYFFLQDDNRSQFLPYYMHNYVSILNGEIALFNFHQFMGEPFLALGQPAVFYLPMYISMSVSHVILGHYYASIDILVIMSLIIGSVGVFFIIEALTKNKAVSVFAGLTWSLGSFVIYVSNSWVVVAAVVAYFPWMIYLGIRLLDCCTKKIMILSIIIKTLFFYSGHIQYFVYTVIFEFITLFFYTYFTSKDSERKNVLLGFIKSFAKQYIVVFILALPMLLPMYNQMSLSSLRAEKLPFQIFASNVFELRQLLLGLFFPFLSVNEGTYCSNFNLQNLSHIGYMPLIIFIVAFVGRFIRRNGSEEANKKHILKVFVIPAIIAFLWTTSMIFNSMVYNIPILNRFRWPFKMAIFLDFYLVLISALLLWVMLSRFNIKKSKANALIFAMIGLQILNFGFLYTQTPYRSFSEYHSDKLPTKEIFKEQLKEGRIISVGFDIWKSSPENNREYETMPSMSFNYATLFGLDYFAGYNAAFILETNKKATMGLNYVSILKDVDRDKVEQLRKSGVKWYIVPKEKKEEYTVKLGQFGMDKRLEDEIRVIFYDKATLPMLYAYQNNSITEYNYKRTTNTISANVDSENGITLVFNYVYNPFFEGYVDGEKVKVSSCDDDSHFSIDVPAGSHDVKVEYRDPYFILGCKIAFGFLALMVIYGLYRKFKKKEENSL